MIRALSVGIVLFISCFIVHAEDEMRFLVGGGINSLLATKNSFAIKVDDQVTGGCLPNPRQLKDELEISLRKNGFNIEKESDSFSNTILISALGYKMGKYKCVVYISANITFPIIVKVPFSNKVLFGGETFVPFRHQILSGLLTGEVYSIQKRLSKQMKEVADKVYLEISRAKDKIFSRFPSIKKEMLKHQKYSK